MATHSSTLAWKIPWMEEPGGLQSMGSLRVGHDWETSLSCIGEGNGNPLQCSCLENPRDSGAWWAAFYGVAQSRTRLKRLSSSSSSQWQDSFPVKGSGVPSLVRELGPICCSNRYCTANKTQCSQINKYFFLLKGFNTNVKMVEGILTCNTLSFHVRL